MKIYDIRPPIKYWKRIPKDINVINLRDFRLAIWKGELYRTINGGIAKYKIKK